jgi:hypothetical protein
VKQQQQQMQSNGIRVSALRNLLLLVVQLCASVLCCLLDIRLSCTHDRIWTRDQARLLQQQQQQQQRRRPAASAGVAPMIAAWRTMEGLQTTMLMLLLLLWHLIPPSKRAQQLQQL